MDPISQGQTGPAVADIQERLERLGFAIADSEKTGATYGKSTASAVAKFRATQNLEATGDVDATCWELLVDASFKLGDRTLYLRLPFFHGHDVAELQTALGVLGFPPGEVDGYYGSHTEAAVKQFQQNIGLLADGICFQDTIDAILRLHHVWENEVFAGAPPQVRPLGFARAAGVLEKNCICLCATDAITRAIAGRIWNLASATSENSGLLLLNSAEEAASSTDIILKLTCERKRPDAGWALVLMEGAEHELAMRLAVSFELSHAKPIKITLRMPKEINDYTGAFTAARAQALAASILDALCLALSEKPQATKH